MESSFDRPEGDAPSAEVEVMRDQAAVLGRDRPKQAWVLTSWDVWVENPYYLGPPQPHPEDC